MRTTLTIALCLGLLLPTCKLHSLASLVTFEGEIEMSTTTGPTPIPTPGFSVLFEMKGDKVRTESKGVAGLGSFVSITDASAKKTWTVDNAAHTYSEIDLVGRQSDVVDAENPAATEDCEDGPQRQGRGLLV